MNTFWDNIINAMRKVLNVDLLFYQFSFRTNTDFVLEKMIEDFRTCSVLDVLFTGLDLMRVSVRPVTINDILAAPSHTPY
jgi:hypothetical protein